MPTAGTEVQGRAFSTTSASFRDAGYPCHPCFPNYGGCSASGLRGAAPSREWASQAAASNFPSSASVPSFIGSGTKVLPRRYSQQLCGASSPLAGSRCEPDATVGPAVYVMLPLDTVNADGVFRYAGSQWFSSALQLLVSTGVHGVACDFWWGAIEKSPGQYNWAGYKQVVEVIKQTGLKIQAVMSFHACGGNVGDTVQVPLPEWVLQCGEADPDLFFADRPRNGGLGNRNREYISIWADDAAGVLRGRSPMQCYEDFMVSFRDNFSQELGSVVDEVVVGAGPCGELRLPSYVEANGWRFPGAGEFQCYDRRALASLAQAAREAGHPEWGYTGPHDAGEYNSTPEHTGFFAHNGSWNTPYGRWFLEWYSNCLLKHGERLLGVASQVFAARLVANQQPPSSSLHANLSSCMLHHSASQPCTFGVGSGNSSGGRMSTLSLNRILETGGSSNGSGDAADGFSTLPPPGLSSMLSGRRRDTDGAAGAGGSSSISPSCTFSSMSGFVMAGSGSSGLGSGITAMQPAAYSGSGGMRVLSAFANSAHADPSTSGGGGGGSLGTMHGGGSLGTMHGGGSLGTMHGPLVGAAAALSRGASAMYSATALLSQQQLAQLHIHAHQAAVELVASGPGRGGGSGVGAGRRSGGGAGPGSGGNSGASSATASGSGCGVGCHVADATMIDVEPSDASHSSAVPVDMLQQALHLNTSGGSSGAVGGAAAAAGGGSGGPASLSAGRFRSSASTLAEAEPMFGSGTGFAVAAAAATAGVLIASGGTARMDLCTSLSSLSTEYTTTTGVGAHGGGMLYLDVAASLVGDDESEVGTSCCTGGAAEDNDELFGLATAPPPSSRHGGGRLSEHGALLASSSAAAFGDDGRRESLDLSGGLPIGVGVVGAAVANPVMSLLSPTASCSAAGALPVAGGSAGGCVPSAPVMHLALKIAGIHWWYRSRSHAAELTAGYYNVEGRCGYAGIVDLCARHRANLVLTCVEMCDSQHPAAAQCGPEGLLRQLRQLAARAGVSLSGENALPIFSSGGVDVEALDRIVNNMRAWSAPGAARGTSPAPTPTWVNPHPGAPAFNGNGAHTTHAYAVNQHGNGNSGGGHPPGLQQTASVGGAVAGNGNGNGNGAPTGNIVCVGYRMSESGRMVPVGSPASAVVGVSQLQQAYMQQQQQQQQQLAQGSAGGPGSSSSLQVASSVSEGQTCPSPPAPDVMPALRAFTFLRLVPELLLPGYQSLWLKFMQKLLSSASA
ncbi:hypothetical protein HYH03_008736 [Edaphochlamys debaryana]|uniref:Beta-amylase n=1 Tax=Edaphochlamys debaryana TaxID=47281 RepID=A0A835Y1R0_9CHLO|nr:hypothetical protein HYH03_008736 [Edaphochlamys debaryana]|eukprot:KAG2493073.1 hypothetical protein HYH03_008736 [Edaphochlamys debaryana]